MSSSSSFVDSKIAAHKVVVFSKTYCPYCTKAKNILKKYPIEDIDIIELENNENCDEIQEYLNKLTGAKTVSAYKTENMLSHICFIGNLRRIIHP